MNSIYHYFRIIIVFLKLAIVLVSGLLFFSCTQGKNYEPLDFTQKINNEELQLHIQKVSTNSLYFGFDIRNSPEEDSRQYLPFIEYLERSTGYNIRLKLVPENGNIVDELGAGTIQFAAIGAVSSIIAENRYGTIPVVRGLNESQKAEYSSVIVVSPDSTIKKIEDLKGKNFAFGGITSTQGHLIPRIILEKNGLTLGNLGSYEYTGSHVNVITAVVSGLVDAGGLQDTLGLEMEKKGQVRVLYRSGMYPASGISANAELAVEIIEEVKRALIDFQPKGRDARGLYNWEKTEMPNGFIEAKKEDYDALEFYIESLDFLSIIK